MDSTEHAQHTMRRLAEAIVDKTWEVPAYEGSGPVTMSLRLPEVTVTDSEGRYIVISPRQSEQVGSHLASISDWLGYGDEDYVEPAE